MGGCSQEAIWETEAGLGSGLFSYRVRHEYLVEGSHLHHWAVCPPSLATSLSAWAPHFAQAASAPGTACTLPVLASTSDPLGQAFVGAQTRVGSDSHHNQTGTGCPPALTLPRSRAQEE